MLGAISVGFGWWFLLMWYHCEKFACNAHSSWPLLCFSSFLFIGTFYYSPYTFFSIFLLYVTCLCALILNFHFWITQKYLVENDDNLLSLSLCLNSTFLCLNSRSLSLGALLTPLSDCFQFVRVWVINWPIAITEGNGWTLKITWEVIGLPNTESKSEVFLFSVRIYWFTTHLFWPTYGHRFSMGKCFGHLNSVLGSILQTVLPSHQHPHKEVARERKFPSLRKQLNRT